MYSLVYISVSFSRCLGITRIMQVSEPIVVQFTDIILEGAIDEGSGRCRFTGDVSGVDSDPDRVAWLRR